MILTSSSFIKKKIIIIWIFRDELVLVNQVEASSQKDVSEWKQASSFVHLRDREQVIDPEAFKDACLFLCVCVCLTILGHER